jgi:hypothetical protein
MIAHGAVDGIASAIEVPFEIAAQWRSSDDSHEYTSGIGNHVTDFEITAFEQLPELKEHAEPNEAEGDRSHNSRPAHGGWAGTPERRKPRSAESCR